MPGIRINKAKEKLRQGGVVTTISGLQSSDNIDFLGPLGFDAAWIEMEHGGPTWDQLGDQTRACDLGHDLHHAGHIQRTVANHADAGSRLHGNRRSSRQY